MPLTPAELCTVSFSTSRIGESGYHQDEVDEFLGLVHAELLRWNEQNNGLRDQLGKQRWATPPDPQRDPQTPQHLGLAGTPLRPPSTTDQTPPSGAHTVRAAKILLLAQYEADQLTAHAHAETHKMLHQAQTSSARLLAEAKQQAQDLIIQARTQAEALLQHARSSADTRQRRSQDKATSLEQDATRTHTETLNQLHHDKTLLEDTINELLAVEQHYRTQITTYLHTQLHQLNGGPGSTHTNRPSHSPRKLTNSPLETRDHTSQPTPHQRNHNAVNITTTNQTSDTETNNSGKEHDSD